MRSVSPAIFAALCLQAAEPPLALGQVMPRVVCLASPNHSYACYVPSSWREDQPTPVLFGFSPGAVGQDPVRLFRAAAERLGWIVVGSNDSRNGQKTLARVAMRAMVDDVLARFRVDLQRSAAVGFSGGARMALDCMGTYPKLGGLISIGAFGTSDNGLAGLYGRVGVLLGGQGDFNHWELLEGRQALRQQGWKVWADRFEGGHAWAPETWCDEALVFLHQELQKAADPALREAFVLRRVAAAHAIEREGDLLRALRRWEDLRDRWRHPGATAAVDRLDRLPEVRTERDVELHYLLKMKRMARLEGLRYAEEVNGLLVEAQRGTVAERRQVERLLGGVAGALEESFWIRVERKAWEEARGTAHNLTIIRPVLGRPWALLAMAEAALGHRELALVALKEAVERKFTTPTEPRTLPGLDRLQGDAEAEALMALIKR